MGLDKVCLGSSSIDGGDLMVASLMLCSMQIGTVVEFDRGGWSTLSRFILGDLLLLEKAEDSFIPVLQVALGMLC